MSKLDLPTRRGFFLGATAVATVTMTGRAAAQCPGLSTGLQGPPTLAEKRFNDQCLKGVQASQQRLQQQDNDTRQKIDQGQQVDRELDAVRFETAFTLMNLQRGDSFSLSRLAPIDAEDQDNVRMYVLNFNVEQAESKLNRTVTEVGINDRQILRSAQTGLLPSDAVQLYTSALSQRDRVLFRIAFDDTPVADEAAKVAATAKRIRTAQRVLADDFFNGISVAGPAARDYNGYNTREAAENRKAYVHLVARAFKEVFDRNGVEVLAQAGLTTIEYNSKAKTYKVPADIFVPSHENDELRLAVFGATADFAVELAKHPNRGNYSKMVRAESNEFRFGNYANFAVHYQDNVNGLLPYILARIHGQPAAAALPYVAPALPAPTPPDSSATGGQPFTFKIHKANDPS